MNFTRQFLFRPFTIHFFLSVKIFRTPPTSPVLLPHSISSDRSISPINLPVCLPSQTSEAVQADEAESDSKQMVQVPSQSSEQSSDAWILASRTPRFRKKPVDTHFMARMAHIRRQSSNSTGLTSRNSLILRVSDMSLSATCSESPSVASLPPVVEFPPTPVFKDEIPEGIMERVKVASTWLFSSTSRGPFIDVPVVSISQCCCSICQRGELFEVKKICKADERSLI